MPKKSEPKLKSLLKELAGEVIASLISSLHGKTSSILAWAKDMKGLKRKIAKRVACVIFVISGLTVFGLGLAQYIAFLIPSLQNGLSYIIIGAVLIAAGFLYKYMG